MKGRQEKSPISGSGLQQEQGATSDGEKEGFVTN